MTAELPDSQSVDVVNGVALCPYCGKHVSVTHDQYGLVVHGECRHYVQAHERRVIGTKIIVDFDRR